MLVGYHQKDDPARYRHVVCDAAYDSVIFLAGKKVVALKNNHNGTDFDENATSDDFVTELLAQKAAIISSGEVQLCTSYFCSD